VPASSSCMFELGQAPKAATLPPEPVTRLERESADTEQLRLLLIYAQCALPSHSLTLLASDLTLSIRHCNGSNQGTSGLPKSVGTFQHKKHTVVGRPQWQVQYVLRFPTPLPSDALAPPPKNRKSKSGTTPSSRRAQVHLQQELKLLGALRAAERKVMNIRCTCSLRTAHA
jgi:hypothetical protein